MSDLVSRRAVFRHIGEDTLGNYISEELVQELGLPTEEGKVLLTQEQISIMSALLVAMRRYVSEFPFDAFQEGKEGAENKYGTPDSKCPVCGAEPTPVLHNMCFKTSDQVLLCPCCSSKLVRK